MLSMLAIANIAVVSNDLAIAWSDGEESYIGIEALRRAHATYKKAIMGRYGSLKEAFQVIDADGGATTAQPQGDTYQIAGIKLLASRCTPAPASLRTR